MELVLGSDPDLLRRLREHLKLRGARTIDRGGDPFGADFTTVTMLIDDLPLVIDWDNWTGITLDGPDELVTSIHQYLTTS